MYSQNSQLVDSDSYENHNAQAASSPKTNADIKNLTNHVNELITRCQVNLVSYLNKNYK